MEAIVVAETSVKNTRVIYKSTLYGPVALPPPLWKLVSIVKYVFLGLVLPPLVVAGAVLYILLNQRVVDILVHLVLVEGLAGRVLPDLKGGSGSDWAVRLCPEPLPDILTPGTDGKHDHRNQGDDSHSDEGCACLRQAKQNLSRKEGCEQELRGCCGQGGRPGKPSK